MSSEFSSAFQALIDYIESKNFNHTPYPEEKRVTLSLSGKNANFRFTARITNDDDYLQVSALYPFSVREEKLRPSTAELITRANYCMPLGKFEMDMADGEVRFHLTHVIGELGLTSEMIEKHFMTAYFTMDRYFPAFMQHIHAGYTPEDAVFHAEMDLQLERPANGPKPSKNAWANPEATTQPHPFDSTKGEAKTRPKKSPGGQDELPL